MIGSPIVSTGTGGEVGDDGSGPPPLAQAASTTSDRRRMSGEQRFLGVSTGTVWYTSVFMRSIQLGIARGSAGALEDRAQLAVIGVRREVALAHDLRRRDADGERGL